MRALLLIAGTALALTACKNNDQTDKTQNFDENLTAENIVSNDVTAIDAVTGDAANMAADVNYNLDENSLGNDSNAAESKPGAKSTAKPVSKAAPPAETNSNDNAE
jgi:hypothetical protein